MKQSSLIGGIAAMAGGCSLLLGASLAPAAYRGATYAYGINNAGDVSGSFFGPAVGQFFTHGFVESAEVYTNTTPVLPAFPEATTQETDNFFGLNDSGDVAGYFIDNVSDTYHGFVESGGVYTTLTDPAATYGTVALGINNADNVVGTFYDASGQYGFFESGGIYTTLTVPGAIATVASGINDTGEVAGTFEDASGEDHGFVESGGIYTILDDPAAFPGMTFAEGINDAGDVAGFFGGASGYQGFVATPI